MRDGFEHFLIPFTADDEARGSAMRVQRLQSLCFAIWLVLLAAVKLADF